MPITNRWLRQISACVFATAATLLGSTEAAHAQSTPEFFFETPGTTPTSYTQGLSSQSIAAGGSVTLSVWYQFQSATTYYGMDVFVGYDQTNTAGSSATPENDTVTLPNGATATSAITNINPILTALSDTLGGGLDPSSATSPATATRPYGDDVNLGSTSVSGFSAPGSTPVHIFDITLHNADLGAGGSQQIDIYSNDPNGSGSDFTTYLATSGGQPDTYARPAASYIMSLFQPTGTGFVPEPDSVALMGLAGIGALPLLRRRSGKISRRG